MIAGGRKRFDHFGREPRLWKSLSATQRQSNLPAREISKPVRNENFAWYNFERP